MRRFTLLLVCTHYESPSSSLSVSHSELCRDDIWGFTWKPQSSLTLRGNANEYWLVCWVTGNGREELAGVTLAVPFPLIQGYERLFDRQIGNISGMYVTLVPWWRERRRYVPMPQFEPSLVAWDLFSAPQLKTWWVDAPVALLHGYARGVAQVCKIHSPLIGASK